LIPILNSGSSSTLYVRIFSCGTPCRSKTCMTAREKPHCCNSGVPFIKRTSGEASMAFWICMRASEERSRRRANDVAEGEPRVKGESWGKYEHKSLDFAYNPFTHREPRDRPEHGRNSDSGQLCATWLVGTRKVYVTAYDQLRSCTVRHNVAGLSHSRVSGMRRLCEADQRDWLPCSKIVESSRITTPCHISCSLIFRALHLHSGHGVTDFPSPSPLLLAMRASFSCPEHRVLSSNGTCAPVSGLPPFQNYGLEAARAR